MKNCSEGCLGIYSERGPVPRSLICQRVKIPPVLFTRNLFKKG
jgi:hypothetical protein